MFDVDTLIADCVAANREANPIVAMKEVLDRTLANAGDIADALPADHAKFALLHSSPDLSILQFVWAPAMSIPPHDHLMWAVNGIYTGEEDNVFFRRALDGLVESGGKRVSERESAMLGRDVIHAVTNPRTHACTGSIHVYGGDYLRQQRSIWDPETHEESPADGDTIRRIFEEANAASEQ